MAHPSVAPLSALVRLVMADIREPEDWVPLPPRDAAFAPTLPESRADRRDPLRNLWLSCMVDELYLSARPSKESQAFFRGCRMLDLTLQSGGESWFPHASPGSVRAACAAFYRPDGWVLVWSEEHGAGKSTFALWLVLRAIRLLAEERADLDIICSSYSRSTYPILAVQFCSWPRAVGEMKAQIGRSGARDATLPRLRQADILVLEDIGQMTPWEGNLLEDLLGARYASKQRTIVVPRAQASLSDIESNVLGRRIMGFCSQRGAKVGLGGHTFREATTTTTTTTTPF